MTLKYLASSEKIRTKTSRIAQEMLRCLNQVTRETFQNVRRKLRKMSKKSRGRRVLAIIEEDDDMELVKEVIPEKVYRVSFKSVDELLEKNLISEGLENRYDIILLFSNSLELRRVLNELDDVYVIDLCRPFYENSGGSDG